jgi:hypothetical protein
MAPSVTYYELLGVTTDASIDDINKAANVKLKQIHPEVVAENQKPIAHERTVVLIDAKRVLTDPILRKQYDESLARPASIPFTCRFVKHDWYEIPAIDDLHPCGRIFVCRRCNERKPAKAHQLSSDWHYYKEKSCQQARKCTRCHEYANQFDMEVVLTIVGMAVTNTPPPHFKWSDWKKVEGKCQEMRRCERCNEKQVRQTIHVFGPWAWVDEKSRCDQRRLCTGCGQVETRMRHDFSGRKRSIETGGAVICCAICGCEESA